MVEENLLFIYNNVYHNRRIDEFALSNYYTLVEDIGLLLWKM